MKLLLLLVLALPLVFYVYTAKAQKSFYMERPAVRSVQEIVALFPSTPEGVKRMADATIAEAKKELERLYEIQPALLTFSNTLLRYDLIAERFGIAIQALFIISQTNTEELVRTAAVEASKELNSFGVDFLITNERIYRLFADYEKKLLEDKTFAAQESLNPVQRKFLTETIRDFRRLGLQLPPDKRARVKEIKKELGVVFITFEQAIAASNEPILLTAEELKGLSEAYKAKLKKNGKGLFAVSVDRHSFEEVSQNAEMSSVREKMYRAYYTRGYPANEKTLETCIQLRDELAHLLGYPSYAHYEIEITMAKTPATVERFLHSIFEKAQLRATVEIEEIKKDLPEGVSLTEDGKFKPWDFAFVWENHKKKVLAMDESAMAAYFPMEYTLPALFAIYENFFGLRFEKVPAKGLWHNDVELLLVYKDDIYRGAVILDPFPRPFKYTHAGVARVVPSFKLNDGTILPSVDVMMVNFPQPSGETPSLLKHRDVEVFFHEFGHAIHNLLGAAEIATFSGSECQQDFVEMPSQMLESWMYDRDVLKRISKHYQTGEQLPDELIEKIQRGRKFGVGDSTLGQLVYTHMSLNCFLPGANKDVAALWREAFEAYRGYIAFDQDNRGYCSFGHLINYGSCYYGYLWSQTFAIDLAKYIEQYGFLDCTIGERYINEVIGKGGSEDPADMLKAFLGREPNSDAFFKDLGL